jgi:thiol-disulfide isomerase/thioredoxin
VPTREISVAKSRSAVLAVGLIVGLAMACWAGYALFFDQKNKLKVGSKAPDWSLKTPGGETISFYSDAADRPALILFWATWCPPCIELMPELSRLQASATTASMKFYALNVHENGDPVEYLRQNGYQFELLLDAEEVERSYGTFGTPRVFLVDPAKTVRYVRRPGTSVKRTVVELTEAIEDLPM